MRGFTGILRVGLAIAALIVVVGLAFSYFGEYRAAQNASSEAPGSEVGTSTGETTGTSEATGKSTPSGTGSKSAGKTVIVKIEGLNFRIDPKAGAEVYRGLDKGERLTWLETKDGWYKVKDGAGRVGYVSANEQYTTLSE